MITKYKSALDFKKHVLFTVDNGDLESALRLIHEWVEEVISAPVFTAKIFSSENFDEICQKIGAISLEKIKNDLTFDDSSSFETFTYTATKIEKSGGHTRVIENFITARPNARHFILLTGLEGKSDIDYFLSVMRQQKNVHVETSPSTSHISTLLWLQKRLIEISAHNNYLFNHHQDSVAVAAFQPKMLKKATFYHHGDHHLCLGVHVNHIEHVDFHPMGYHYCSSCLGIKNIYIPLISDDKGERSTLTPFKKNGYLITATAARSNKIEVPYHVNYLQVIPELLLETKGRHVHIGKISLIALIKIRRNLKKLGIPSDNFIYIPWVPSVWKALHDHNVDLYVASFPYGGAITLIEAMGAGIPVALHKHIYARVLGCIDLGYKGVFYWENPKDLITYCKNLTCNELRKLSIDARNQYNKFHHPQILQDVLTELVVIDAPPNVMKRFVTNTDELIVLTKRQMSLFQLIKQTIYKNLKKIRAKFL